MLLFHKRRRQITLIMPEWKCDIWASSSAGRAPALQAGGSAFESRLVHHLGLFSVSCPFNSESA